MSARVRSRSGLRPRQATRRGRRWVAVLGSSPLLGAIAVAACGGAGADATLLGNGVGHGSASDASEFDVVWSPQTDSSLQAPSDGGAADVEADGDAPPPPGPAPAGLVRCGATTCDLGEAACCGNAEGVRVCLPFDAGSSSCTNVDTLLWCDSTDDCSDGKYCRLTYSRFFFSSQCSTGSWGYPSVANNELNILACDPNPTPPNTSCPGGAPCIRQRCGGFDFDLCGVIPDGGCDPN